uniref:FaeA/PapI family transcriptional regulator n=1 Tax=Micrococcus sp. HSID17228 TaxID=2419507 RepID=UPI00352A0EA7
MADLFSALGRTPLNLDRTRRPADPETALSAAEVGERLGISRVTARRYLEHLERIRRVRRSARHDGRRRPEQEYRWAGRT